MYTKILVDHNFPDASLCRPGWAGELVRKDKGSLSLKLETIKVKKNTTGNKYID